MINQPKPPAPQQELSAANIKLPSGKVVQVLFPETMNDDDLLMLIMEMAKSLRVASRVEMRAKVGKQILIPPPGMRV